ncbi:LysM peptidoglycan-binding domain-containing protein [Latilactobacillus curvatus]|uniref:LysM peptidoglycan-binding domain-containing protein n=1 Tax=Latilactobacillus curvatus TaxID=28038 RepID=A0A385ADE2_LATCU|nr:LysM domain-containing protein [Latilactobacillus curvatus]AWV72788.1 LysM peptidoglycan-binding domain-containing protein [Latilactobacillus curvatus]AXN35685.1 LysM peptidoglycan-binding domain-containing protein [Latilactobacillus curvatus]EHE86648.1 lysM domain protein [Latilactobacillus curvatus CRL 705]MCM6843844.1 LysM peptidoglycan-binding domain-containing protein [Latilactobacillus curvatus]MCM6861269.1 LysM peptidoglycan-binding domain-containing protein [Latilactobacillus curvat
MKSFKTLLLSATLTTAATAGLLFVGQSKASAATTYTVATGDTLSTIAQKFAGNTDLVNQIATTNNIQDINMIFVGEQLTIDTDQTATPVQTTTPVVVAQPAAVQTPAPVVQAQPTVQATPVQQTAAVAPTTSSAKEWIAQKESGGSYSARNGQMIGRYQLTASYLNGDYSAANQDRVADQYVTSRYGSWDAAKSFWLSNGWY